MLLHSTTPVGPNIQKYIINLLFDDTWMIDNLVEWYFFSARMTGKGDLTILQPFDDRIKRFSGREKENNH